MRITRNKKAFTIVELIIVIAVIGVLAAILIPTFSGVINKANLKSAYSDAKNQLTKHITDLEGNGTDGAKVLDDTVFVTHKAGMLYFFQYTKSEGKLTEATVDPVPCDADPRAVNYSELVDIAANAAIDEMVHRGEMLGTMLQMAGTSNSDAALGNVKLYAGSILQDEAVIGHYFDTPTPVDTLTSRTTTVTNSEGAPVPAIRLESEVDLYSFACYINNGTLPNSTNILLAKDMFMGGIEWAPIGGNGHSFIGTFDGNGHTIYDLRSSGVVSLPFQYGGETINFGGCALFGETDHDSANGNTKSLIKNVKIVNATSDSSPAAAALAIYAYNVVAENVHVYGTIKAPTNVGGIFWYSTGTVLRSCIVEADLITTGNASSTLAGGMVAQSSGDIQFINCEYSGTIQQTEDAMTKRMFAGFIVAYCYEYNNYFQNFTVGLGSKIIGNATNAAFTGEDFEGNPITNNVPLLRYSDSSVYATGTNLFGYRAYVLPSDAQVVYLYNLGI